MSSLSEPAPDLDFLVVEVYFVNANDSGSTSLETAKAGLVHTFMWFPLFLQHSPMERKGQILNVQNGQVTLAILTT